MSDSVPKREVNPILNAIGLGVPGLMAGQQDRYDEAQYNAQRDRYGKAAASLGLGAGDIGAVVQVASADPSIASGMLASAASRNAPLTELQQAELARVEQQTAASRAAEMLAQAREGQVPIQNRIAQQKLNNDLLKSQVANRKDFQAAVQSNDVIKSGVQGTQRLMQLRQTLQDPGSTQLDIANAAVLLSQIVEPGLAVRNDDRMAVDQNSSSTLQQLGRAVNQFVSGELTPEQKKIVTENILRTGMNLLRPLMGATSESLSYWQDAALNTPGVQQGDVSRILGIDEMTLSLIKELSAEDI